MIETVCSCLAGGEAIEDVLLGNNKGRLLGKPRPRRGRGSRSFDYQTRVAGACLTSGTLSVSVVAARHLEDVELYSSVRHEHTVVPDILRVQSQLRLF